MLLGLRKSQLDCGMILKQNVYSKSGNLLIAVDTEITQNNLCIINESFDGNELLVDETRIYDTFEIEEKDVVSNAKSILVNGFSKDDSYILLSALKYSIGGHFEKVYQQLLDLMSFDVISYNHSMNVTWLSLYLALKIEIPREDRLDLLHAALLHDIGKIFISHAILSKVTKLTEKEFNVIKSHPVIGSERSRLFVTENVSSLIRSHHEYLNGTGYPDKLDKSTISMIGHMITVSDILDALMQRRVYKLGMPPGQAISILYKEVREGKLCEQYVDVFNELYSSIKDYDIFKFGTDVACIYK